MAAHAIRDGKPVCIAPVGADCRLEPDTFDCECESWTIERDDTGAFHQAVVHDDEDRKRTERHPMQDGGECQFLPYWNDSWSPLVDWYTGDGAPDHDGPMVVEWEDGPTWDYADEQPAAR